jgi:hypothetical protein
VLILHPWPSSPEQTWAREGWGGSQEAVSAEVLLLPPPQTNVALVAPLLRLENNHCHIEESEHVLKKAHKYSELIILYEKGDGRRGFCMLIECVKSPMGKRLMILFLGFVVSSAGAGGPVQESKLPTERP